MQIDWWTLGLQTVNVLILVWILARYLFRPVTAMIAERQAAATAQLDAAEAMRAEADAAKAKLGEEAAKLAAERAETLQQAVNEAGKEKAALIAAARAEADKLRTEARAEIERLREGEETETADRASRLAADIAAKLFARLPDEARISGFIDGLAEGVASLPETTRNELGADGSALRLKAARTLTDAEAEACRAKLSAVLGRRVEIAAEADPSLLAGLELDAPHAIVRNSFRADLDRIVAELTRHGG